MPHLLDIISLENNSLPRLLDIILEILVNVITAVIVNEFGITAKAGEALL